MANQQEYLLVKGMPVTSPSEKNPAQDTVPRLHVT